MRATAPRLRDPAPPGWDLRCEEAPCAQIGGRMSPRRKPRRAAGGREVDHVEVSVSSRWEAAHDRRLTRCWSCLSVVRAGAGAVAGAPAPPSWRFAGIGSSDLWPAVRVWRWLDGRPVNAKEIEYFRLIPTTDSRRIFCGRTASEV